MCVFLLFACLCTHTHIHTTTQPGLRNHIMRWNDCETSTCKDTNTHTHTQALSHIFLWITEPLFVHLHFIQPHTQTTVWKATHAYTQTPKNTHHTVSSAPWFKSLAGSEFSCSQNALLLLLCLTGAWFALGPFYILSLLSSQHTGVPEGLYDPHFTYFDCFWEKLLFWLALSYWCSTPWVW